MQQQGNPPVWKAPDAAARAMLTAGLCNHVAPHGRLLPRYEAQLVGVGVKGGDQLFAQLAEVGQCLCVHLPRF